MADFGSPVAQNVNPAAQGIQTLSGLLGLKQQQLGLQSSQLGLQQQQQALAGGAADVQKKQAITQDLMTARQIVSDPAMKDESGQPDLAKIASALASKAPTALETVYPAVVKASADRVALSSAVQSLDNQSRKLVGAALGTSTNREDADKNLSLLAEQVPQTRAAVAALKSRLPSFPEDPNDPSKFAAFRDHIRDSYIDVGEQYAGTAPQVALPNTGAAIVPTQTNLRATLPVGQVGPRLGTSVPPGMQTFQDKAGNTWAFNPQAPGQATLVGQGGTVPTGGGGGIGGGQGGASPPAGQGKTSNNAAAGPANVPNKPAVFNTGDVEAIHAQTEQNFSNVNANRQAANLAPQQLDQIRKALDISATANTGGDWTAKRAQIEANLSTVIPGLKTAQDDASKIQVLDKFLTRITNDSNKVLGQNASTDAQRDSIAHQNAQIGYTPQAIHSVLKYAEAQTLAMQAKGNAQDAWLKQAGHGITNQHEFETEWRNAYDPVLFQLEAASPQERIEMVKGLDPKEAASLAAKRQALKALGVTLP